MLTRARPWCTAQSILEFKTQSEIYSCGTFHLGGNSNPFHFYMVWRSSVRPSVCPLAISCLVNILKSLWVTVMVLNRKIGHGQKITHMHFEVNTSNVKVTLPFNAKTMSAQYLKMWLSFQLVGKVLIVSKWSLYILRSLGQRSRSQYYLMQKPCPLNVLKIL